MNYKFKCEKVTSKKKFAAFKVGHQRVRGCPTVYIFNCSLKSELCERMVRKIAGAWLVRLSFFLLFVILDLDAFGLLPPEMKIFKRSFTRFLHGSLISIGQSRSRLSRDTSSKFVSVEYLKRLRHHRKHFVVLPLTPVLNRRWQRSPHCWWTTCIIPSPATRPISSLFHARNVLSTQVYKRA